MPDWDPALYLRFEDERTRPARDLLARVNPAAARFVVDLGCGPGNSTALLDDRFAGAEVLGLDSSAAMITAARERLPHCRFMVADLMEWTPDRAADVIFANAVLQWLPDHPSLLRRLFQWLAPGGVLAIQMPDNLDEPSHRAMRHVASDPRWATKLRAASAERTRLPALSTYYDVLAGEGAAADVWRTTYYHTMQTPAAIVDWLAATGLRPFLSPLSANERADFLKEYEAELEKHYPIRTDGRRLLQFPRVFIVGRRAD